MVLYSVTSTYEGRSTIFANSMPACAPIGREVDPLKATADTDGDKVFKAGMFTGTNPGGTANTVRLLPRATLTAAVLAASDDTLTVGDLASVFVVGDVLSVIAPYARIDLALTWADADTLEVVLDNMSYTHTVSGYTTLAALATTIAADLNASYLGTLAAFTAQGANIHVVAKDYRSGYSIAVTATTAGDGTGVVNGSATDLTSPTSVGTILSIDTTAGTITLAANTAIDLASGMSVGVADSIPDGLGMIGNDINLTSDPSNDHGLYQEGVVYIDALPYYDTGLNAIFPKLIFE